VFSFTAVIIGASRHNFKTALDHVEPHADQRACDRPSRAFKGSLAAEIENKPSCCAFNADLRFDVFSMAQLPGVWRRRRRRKIQNFSAIKPNGWGDGDPRKKVALQIPGGRAPPVGPLPLGEDPSEAPVTIYFAERVSARTSPSEMRQPMRSNDGDREKRSYSERCSCCVARFG
jgi:hypothetical protein